MSLRAILHEWKNPYEKDAVAIYENSNARPVQAAAAFFAVVSLILSAAFNAIPIPFLFPHASLLFLLMALVFITASVVRRRAIIFTPTQIVFRSAMEARAIPFSGIVEIQKTKVLVSSGRSSYMADAVALRFAAMGTSVFRLEVDEPGEVLRRLSEATGKPISTEHDSVKLGH